MELSNEMVKAFVGGQLEINIVFRPLERGIITAAEVKDGQLHLELEYLARQNGTRNKPEETWTKLPDFCDGGKFVVGFNGRIVNDTDPGPLIIEDLNMGTIWALFKPGSLPLIEESCLLDPLDALTNEMLGRFVGGDMEINYLHEKILRRGRIKRAFIENGSLVVEFEWIAENDGDSIKPAETWTLLETRDYMHRAELDIHTLTDMPLGFAIESPITGILARLFSADHYDLLDLDSVKHP